MIKKIKTRMLPGFNLYLTENWWSQLPIKTQVFVADIRHFQWVIVPTEAIWVLWIDGDIYFYPPA